MPTNNFGEPFTPSLDLPNLLEGAGPEYLMRTLSGLSFLEHELPNDPFIEEEVKESLSDCSDLALGRLFSTASENTTITETEVASVSAFATPFTSPCPTPTPGSAKKRKRQPKQQVAVKDDKYRERRKKNNEAAGRCRARQKLEHEQLRVNYENVVKQVQELTEKYAKLSKENEELQHRLSLFNSVFIKQEETASLLMTSLN
eukprot:Colp12_sorted_trinity150504_noHs@31224